MRKGALVFDGVLFWDLAGERRLHVAGPRTIRDISLLPLPGDRVSFEKDDEQFSVVYREFQFRRGRCFVTVNLQPAGRETKPKH